MIEFIPYLMVLHCGLTNKHMDFPLVLDSFLEYIYNLTIFIGANLLRMTKTK